MKIEPSETIVKEILRLKSITPQTAAIKYKIQQLQQSLSNEKN
jgi:hypothetical protein